MFIRVWRYVAASGREADFERVYGPEGDWAQLFSVGDGYRRTELLRGAAAGEYLVIDRWVSRDAWQAFLDAHRTAYDALDRRCRALTESEVPVGDYVPVEPAALESADDD